MAEVWEKGEVSPSEQVTFQWRPEWKHLAGCVSGWDPGVLWPGPKHSTLCWIPEEKQGPFPREPIIWWERLVQHPWSYLRIIDDKQRVTNSGYRLGPERESRGNCRVTGESFIRDVHLQLLEIKRIQGNGGWTEELMTDTGREQEEAQGQAWARGWEEREVYRTLGVCRFCGRRWALGLHTRLSTWIERGTPKMSTSGGMKKQWKNNWKKYGFEHQSCFLHFGK